MSKPLQVLEVQREPCSGPETRSAWRWRGWWCRAVKLVLLGMVVFFVGRSLLGQLAALSWRDLEVRPAWIGLAFVALLAAKAMTLLAYRPLVAPFCGSLGFRQLAPLAWLPPLGRYVPGKIVSVTWAMAILRNCGASAAATLTVPFLMTSMGMLAGLTVAAPLVLWQPIRDKLPSAWGWCLVLLGVGVGLLHPSVLRRVGNGMLRWFGRPGCLVLPSMRQYVVSVLALLGQLLFAGMTLWMLARALTDITVAWLPVCVAAVGLAAILGLLAFFAPAGIGVREGILLVILGPIIDQGLAAVLVLALRCLQTAADVLLAGVGWAVGQSDRLER